MGFFRKLFGSHTSPVELPPEVAAPEATWSIFEVVLVCPECHWVRLPRQIVVVCPECGAYVEQVVGRYKTIPSYQTRLNVEVNEQYLEFESREKWLSRKEKARMAEEQS